MSCRPHPLDLLLPVVSAPPEHPGHFPHMVAAHNANRDQGCKLGAWAWPWGLHIQGDRYSCKAGSTFQTEKLRLGRSDCQEGQSRGMDRPLPCPGLPVPTDQPPPRFSAFTAPSPRTTPALRTTLKLCGHHPSQGHSDLCLAQPEVQPCQPPAPLPCPHVPSFWWGIFCWLPGYPTSPCLLLRPLLSPAPLQLRSLLQGVARLPSTAKGP